MLGLGLYPLLAEALHASYVIVSVKEHSSYESFKRIIIVIFSAVVVGSVEPPAVANFRSPPCYTNHQTTGQGDTWRAAM